MSIEDYKKELESHDWFYGMTEDNGIYRAGLHNEQRLAELSNLSKEHKELFKEYKENHYKKLLG